MTRIALMQQETILQLSKLLDETIKELAQYKSVEAEEERYKEIRGGIDGLVYTSEYTQNDKNSKKDGHPVLE